MSTLNDELVWRIYPNPTASAITINVNIPVEAAIYNVTGSLVKALISPRLEMIDLVTWIRPYILKAGTGTPGSLSIESNK
ncbi:MAG: hypothetical protein IPI23_16355 [Bacteroidetes bacterium]|nr:hypothetical protein [Bacteroidota bacterium]